MITLRPHQQQMLDLLYDYLRLEPGNPCIEFPTGAGKSLLIAEICRREKDKKILMITHVQELIEQNYKELKRLDPELKCGIYAAALGQKDLRHNITFASIQSIHKVARFLNYIDLIIVDEAHLISHASQGMYINVIQAIGCRVIGLTATPFRSGHGLITDKPAIFDHILKAEWVGADILSLIKANYLVPLRSRLTQAKLETDGIKITKGDFDQKQMQLAFDTKDKNEKVVSEIIFHGRQENRKSWLIFCSGKQHAEHINKILCEYGIHSACVFGDSADREESITAFKAHELQCLVTVNVLSTGFNHPATDMICFLYATTSPSKYIQCAGRGTRISPGKKDCLVLDFAGVVERHGPITDVETPKKKGEKKGDCPTKVCDACHEICHVSAKKCSNCGELFPIKPKDEELELRHHDIMTGEKVYFPKSWEWSLCHSHRTGKPILKCTYLCSKKIDEFITLGYEGFPGHEAKRKLKQIINGCQVTLNIDADFLEIIDTLNKVRPPHQIGTRKNGKFENIVWREFGRMAGESSPNGSRTMDQAQSS